MEGSLLLSYIAPPAAKKRKIAPTKPDADAAEVGGEDEEPVEEEDVIEFGDTAAGVDDDDEEDDENGDVVELEPITAKASKPVPARTKAKVPKSSKDAHESANDDEE